LSEDFSIETSIVVGELYRRNGEWKFKAVGQGYKDGLVSLLRAHGVNV
jgi:tellurium resistance protein TerD